MSSRSIFVSYRRQDARASAGRLYETLRAEFGRDLLFKDVDNIGIGRDFRDEVRGAIERSAVMLVVIGPSWVDDRLRVDGDLVRFEVAEALSAGLLVVPILVDGASMPEPEGLPSDLQELVYRNGVALDHDTWDRDAAALLTALSSELTDRRQPDQNEPHLDEQSERGSSDRGRWSAELISGEGPEYRIRLSEETHIVGREAPPVVNGVELDDDGEWEFEHGESLIPPDSFTQITVFLTDGPTSRRTDLLARDSGFWSKRLSG